MSLGFPSPDQPFTEAALLHRWPAGAEKVEVVFGALHFSGSFDAVTWPSLAAHSPGGASPSPRTEP